MLVCVKYFAKRFILFEMWFVFISIVQFIAAEAGQSTAAKLLNLGIYF